MSSLGRQIAEFLVALFKGLMGREEPEKHDVKSTPDKSPIPTTAEDLRRKLDELKRLRRDRAKGQDGSRGDETRSGNDDHGERDREG